MGGWGCGDRMSWGSGEMREKQRKIVLLGCSDHPSKSTYHKKTKRKKEKEEKEKWRRRRSSKKREA